MALRRLFQRNRKADAHQSSLETPAYTSNVTKAPAQTLPGRDSVPVRLPDGADTLGLAEASHVATPISSYSKRPSQNQFYPPSSQLCEYC